MSKDINPTGPVLVTGGSGYIASWIVKTLLDKGVTVKTTVRNKKDQGKYQHLLDIAKNSQGTLEIFEADLLVPGSFHAAMQDCEIVFHTASPFKISGFKDPLKDLVDPALEGTRNVLHEVDNITSVKRVVLTASIATIYGDAVEILSKPGGAFTEKDWNTTSSLTHQPYPYSKTVAEREAWKINSRQTRWDLVTIHPGFVLGPSLTSRVDSTSIDMMRSFFNGKFKMGVPDLCLGIVDVRDVAMTEVIAGFTPSAHGRYLVVSSSMTALEMADILKEDYSRVFPVPSKNLPDFLVYLAGPFMGMPWKYLRKNLGTRISFDNTRARKELGFEFRPARQTILDHASQVTQTLSK
jgi:nucleoside-diphosphate-sugar epimerase